MRFAEMLICFIYGYILIILDIEDERSKIRKIKVKIYEIWQFDVVVIKKIFLW